MAVGLVRRAVRHARWRMARREGTNVEYNRRYWDWYAKSWTDPQFRREVVVDGEPAAEVLGEEWGADRIVPPIVGEWIDPYVDAGSRVGEIGPGGGRIASRVAPHVAEYYGFDISKEMLKRLSETLHALDNVSYVPLAEPRLPAELERTFDFIYAFDVFVHVDLHTQWKYLREMARVLKPGGRAFVHTANLTTERGWQQFAEQDAYRPEDFYFMTPQAVRTLIERAGLELTKESDSQSADNRAAEKDYLALARKPV